MAEAFVTPHLLTWARQRRGLEVEDLAKKLNVKPDAVNAWEAAKGVPPSARPKLLPKRRTSPSGISIWQILRCKSFLCPISALYLASLLGNQVSTFWP